MDTKARILVVNDHLYSAEMRKIVIEQNVDAEVFLAGSHRSALKMLEEKRSIKGNYFFPFHIAYLDMVTDDEPEMLTKLIGELLKSSVEPVLISVYVDNEKRDFAKKLGIDILDGVKVKEFKNDLKERVPQNLERELVVFERVRQRLERR